MRIVQISRCTSWGGGERYTLDLCRALCDRGEQVTLITRGIPSMDAHFSHLPLSMEKMPLGGILDFKSPRLLARLICGFPEERVVVHVHNFKDAELMARAKMIVGKKKNVWLVCTRHLVKPAKVSCRWKWIYDSIDRFILVSDLARREFLSSSPPVDTKKITVVPNSINLPQRYSHPAPPRGGEISLRVLYTGRIAPEKGVDILIRAMKNLSDVPVKLRIVGTGESSYLSSLRNLAEEEGVAGRIEWTGFVDDVYKEIREADICVAPSIWREPFGLTIIEFMSQGRPVVTTDNGAQPEIITPGHDGVLVSPSDASALAEAIHRLVCNPEMRREIGQEAARTFERRFSYHHFFKKILDVYENRI